MGWADKLFVPVCGAPVLAHALMAFQKSPQIGEIVVVAREEQLDRVAELCKSHGIDKASRVMFGGATRLESAISGVYAVSKRAQFIAIHDGARPCVDEAVIARTLAAAVKFGAAAPAVPVSSTLKMVKDWGVVSTVDRDGLHEIQTPQVFQADAIKAALTNAKRKSVNVTDDCSAAELIGMYVRITEGSRNNIKLTTTEDLAFIEAVLANRLLKIEN